MYHSSNINNIVAICSGGDYTSLLSTTLSKEQEFSYPYLLECDILQLNDRQFAIGDNSHGLHAWDISSLVKNTMHYLDLRDSSQAGIQDLPFSFCGKWPQVIFWDNSDGLSVRGFLPAFIRFGEIIHFDTFIQWIRDDYDWVYLLDQLFQSFLQAQPLVIPRDCSITGQDVKVPFIVFNRRCYRKTLKAQTESNEEVFETDLFDFMEFSIDFDQHAIPFPLDLDDDSDDYFSELLMVCDS